MRREVGVDDALSRLAEFASVDSVVEAAIVLGRDAVVRAAKNIAHIYLAIHA